MYLYKNVKPNNNDNNIAKFQDKFNKTISSYIPGTCPISQQLAMLQASISLSCGKCIPCRDGLKQAEILMRDINDLKANEKTFEKLKNLAQTIKDTADCAIGYDAANTIVQGYEIFKNEYMMHIKMNNCSSFNLDCAPCVSYCPANVDIPAYISLISEKRYEDAVRVIRNNNPFVTACAYICEHPCEKKCRRSLLDDSVNIRALKRFAVDNANTNTIKIPECGTDTGKKVAVVGGGPSGLTAAYYLGLMGHKVTIFEEKEKLGGMLYYGIPNYRLPKKRLQQDIDMILTCKNIDVKTSFKVGSKEPTQKLLSKFDASYLSVGAQIGKEIKVPGLKAKGVYSAIDFLHEVAEGNKPKYNRKKVVVIGGGNVAMDAARTALRCGAYEVCVVYRRRKADMTALPSEIEAAIEEGIELRTLYAPHIIKTKNNGSVSALIARPQMISKCDKDGRPKPVPINKPNLKIKCDIIILAIGQDIESAKFNSYGVDKVRKTILVDENMATIKYKSIFAGGDCVREPSTVIKAIADGKNAAINIDKYLGYNHSFKENIEIPIAKPNDRELYGRVHSADVPARIRKDNFDEVEQSISIEEAMQECNKCLRCDYYGCNTVEGA